MLNKKDGAHLETYYRQLLRQIQGLPDTVANAAVYLLLDTIPLEAQLHTHVLGLFGSIMSLEDDHPFRKLALRQMALKDGKSHSWFNYIVSIATIYDKMPWYTLGRRMLGEGTSKNQLNNIGPINKQSKPGE